MSKVFLDCPEVINKELRDNEYVTTVFIKSLFGLNVLCPVITYSQKIVQISLMFYKILTEHVWWF